MIRKSNNSLNDMAKKTINYLKLGLFVVAGIGFLIVLLYVIGRNQNMFGKTFVLKARFENVHGLMRGNNIRFGGVNAGTVGNVDVINDTTFEVTLLVKSKFRGHIHKNARVNITTDGLMGNKLINIIPARTAAPLVDGGDVLLSTKSPDTDEMLEVLANTNKDVAFIAQQLKQTIERVNTSKAVWDILNDETLPTNLRASLLRMKSASENLDQLTTNLNLIIYDVKSGKGTVGELLTDTVIAANINDAINKIKNIGNSADSLSTRINVLVSSIDHQINQGEGTVNALLKDRQMKEKLDRTLKNIELGTKAFNDNMEALKHSFLFRGYFKRVQKQAAGPNSY